MAEEQSRLRTHGPRAIVQGDIRAHGRPATPATARPAWRIGSPPYLNNLDYTMQTRLELFFLGFVRDMDELKSLRKQMMICDAKATYRDIEDWQRVSRSSLGGDISPREIDDKLGDKGWGWDYGRMTRQYFGGLLRALEAIKPMLAPGATVGAHPRRVGPRGRAGARARPRRRARPAGRLHQPEGARATHPPLVVA